MDILRTIRRLTPSGRRAARRAAMSETTMTCELSYVCLMHRWSGWRRMVLVDHRTGAVVELYVDLWPRRELERLMADPRFLANQDDPEKEGQGDIVPFRAVVRGHPDADPRSSIFHAGFMDLA